MAKKNKDYTIELTEDLQGVQLQTMDWNIEYMVDIHTGNGFDVRETIYSKNSTVRNMYGLQSPLFGTDWSDDSAFQELYSCACGEYRGKRYNGETCPKCNTKIDYRDADLKKTAWIDLHGYYVIHPIYYNKLLSMLGKAQFEKILERPSSLNKYGQLIYDKKDQFHGIGIMGLKEQFNELVSYLRSKKSFKKHELLNELILNREKIFVGHIPVYSSVLRPTTFKDGKYTYTTIDKIYSPIFSMSELLKDEYVTGLKTSKSKKYQDMETIDILNSIQTELMKAWEINIDQIGHKEGIIKKIILGGMINLSSRNVIVPDVSLRADQVILNYHAFLELFKYDIIERLSRISNISEYEAKEEWYIARLKFNPRIHAIMNSLIQEGETKIIINRNPTINFGSLMCVRVIKVSIDYADDYTMRLPIAILNTMNADFDGDVLNVIRLVVDEITEAYWKGFNPRKKMFISNNDGKFNMDFMLHKEQLVGVYEFATI